MPTTDAEAPTLGARELVDAMLLAEVDADWERWGQLVAPDVIMDHPTVGPTIGIAENLACLRAFREAVQGYERHVFDLVCDESSAAFRFSITGVLAEPIRDLEPSPAPFEIAGAAFVSTWGGRVVRIVEILTTNTLRAGRG